MNNRERMRASNKLVRQWLLDNGYDDIWFKPHGKRNDYVFTQGRGIKPIHGSYMAQDIWNLFDGICRIGSQIVFLQMSTNAWHPDKLFKDFMKKTSGVKVICFLVSNKRKECNGKYKVFTREYL